MVTFLFVLIYICWYFCYITGYNENIMIKVCSINEIYDDDKNHCHKMTKVT